MYVSRTVEFWILDLNSVQDHSVSDTIHDGNEALLAFFRVISFFAEISVFFF